VSGTGDRKILQWARAHGCHANACSEFARLGKQPLLSHGSTPTSICEPPGAHTVQRAFRVGQGLATEEGRGEQADVAHEPGLVHVLRDCSWWWTGGVPACAGAGL